MINFRCGDLNVSHQSIDLANPSSNAKNAGFTKEERDDFAKILADGFIDSCMLKFSLNILNQNKYFNNLYKVKHFIHIGNSFLLIKRRFEVIGNKSLTKKDR